MSYGDLGQFGLLLCVWFFSWFIMFGQFIFKIFYLEFGVICEERRQKIRVFVYRKLDDEKNFNYVRGEVVGKIGVVFWGRVGLKGR